MFLKIKKQNNEKKTKFVIIILTLQCCPLIWCANQFAGSYIIGRNAK